MLIVAAAPAYAQLPAAPVIDALSPDHGPEHATVEISGSGFTGTTDVSFAGTSAAYTVVDDSKITATVPVGAPTGSVTVTTPVDTATSANDFFVEPNIVMILTDDQRWDTVWSMQTVESEIIGKGITFPNGFVVNSLCCPSRVSFLTGEYSHTSGVYTNNLPYGGFHAFHGDGSTLATWLDDRGYQTGLVGKYLNEYGDDGDASYIPPGWNRWVAFAGPPEYYSYELSIDGVARSFGTTEADYSTDVLTGYADQFVRDAPIAQPLFLWFTPFAPHNPTIPAPRDVGSFAGIAPWRPPSYNEADVSDKPAYVRANRKLSATKMAALDAFRQHQYEALQAVDDHVGSILKALDDTGRLDNTIILYASDNGYLWGEHRLTAKVVPYEESIRIPLVLRWDRLSGAPRSDSHLVANIDVAPTFAELAGTTAPGADGRSFLPLLMGSPVTWRSNFLIEHYGAAQTKQPPTYCAVRNQSQIFVHYATNEEELYTLAGDPYELKNKAGNANLQSTVARLRDRLRTLCNPLPPGMSPF